MYPVVLNCSYIDLHVATVVLPGYSIALLLVLVASATCTFIKSNQIRLSIIFIYLNALHYLRSLVFIRIYLRVSKALLCP